MLKTVKAIYIFEPIHRGAASDAPRVAGRDFLLRPRLA